MRSKKRENQADHHQELKPTWSLETLEDGQHLRITGLRGRLLDSSISSSRSSGPLCRTITISASRMADIANQSSPPSAPSRRSRRGFDHDSAASLAIENHGEKSDAEHGHERVQSHDISSDATSAARAHGWSACDHCIGSARTGTSLRRGKNGRVLRQSRRQRMPAAASAAPQSPRESAAPSSADKRARLLPPTCPHL